MKPRLFIFSRAGSFCLYLSRVQPIHNYFENHSTSLRYDRKKILAFLSDPVARFMNDFMACLSLSLALNCWLQVELVSVMVSAGGPLVLAWRSLRFLSASQILFFHRKLLLC